MTEKTWLKNYSNGVPAEIDMTEFASVVDIFDKSCDRFADKVAFVNFGRELCYRELEARSRAFGAYLQSLGLERGDRVAVMLPNLLQYPIALFGILRAGMVVVNTNPLYTARELKHQLKDSGARAIVVLENFAHTLASVIDDSPVEHVFVTGVGDLLGFPKGALINFALRYVKKEVPAYDLPGAIRFTAALKAGSSATLETPSLGHEDLAFLQYTGGTTGVSKGAMLSHGNIVANVQQASAWLGSLIDPGKEIIVTALPLYHIFALTANCLVFLKFGGRNLLITNPRDMAGFVKELNKEPFTAITGVNTLFNGLLNTAGFDQVDFSHLRLSLGGGMAVQRAVAEKWKAVTKVPLIEAYGLTETSPAACMNPMSLEDYNGAIGLPIPSTECKVIDAEGNEVAAGEPGELCIRGPQVMQGYWQRPDETAKVLNEEGWLKTGDMAARNEDGFFFIVDRKKDLIKVSGFQVWPNEVEAVLITHPGVAECAAAGVPDMAQGERVVAWVVRKDPDLTGEELIDWCRKDLTGYRVPTEVVFIDKLPRTGVGKVLRRELVAKYNN